MKLLRLELKARQQPVLNGLPLIKTVSRIRSESMNHDLFGLAPVAGLSVPSNNWSQSDPSLLSLTA